MAMFMVQKDFSGVIVVFWLSSVLRLLLKRLENLGRTDVSQPRGDPGT